MTRKSLLALVLASSSLACGILSGCASPTDGAADDQVVETPGDGSESALISEHSLTGSELPDHTIALTFDDGPGPRTVELAEYLASEGIPATFFINGNHVPGHQAALDAIVGRGHLLANHTQNHLQLTKLASAKLISEITLTDAVIVDAQPNGPWLLRPPFGAWNGATAAAANRTDMKKYVGSVFWDVGGELTATAAADWACWGKGVSVAKCGSLYVNEIHTRRRGIVLMHDIHNKSVDMVKVMVPQLKAEGYKFVAIPEVPSIKRAIANVGAVAPTDDSCSSSTLGKIVPENTCVQSSATKEWMRCANKEWVTTTGAADAKCAGVKYPLP
jgi:peptidoglycan/xylan/chitin deacetylase (PgdA/CDA1 family)